MHRRCRRGGAGGWRTGVLFSLTWEGVRPPGQGEGRFPQEPPVAHHKEHVQEPADEVEAPGQEVELPGDAVPGDRSRGRGRDKQEVYGVQ